MRDTFSGGDAVTGPATVVEAIAAGKQAALEIDHYLSGAPGPAPVVQVHKRRKEPFLTIPGEEKIATHRTPVSMLDLDSRQSTFAPVELAYSEAEARKEASRCLRCDVCIRCGAYEKMCREGMQVDTLHFSPISATERILSDYQRPGERCIACGACALACPTGAIEYLEAPDRGEVRLCGTILNRLEDPPL